MHEIIVQILYEKFVFTLEYRQMRLSKALSGVIIFTYDVLHNEYSANPRAWNIKFGFSLGKFKLKDLHI